MTRRLSLCTCLLALGVLLSPGSALGAANHPFLSALPAQYEDACGVAAQGGLYVSDYYHDTIDLPGGGKIATESPGGGPCKIALDSAGDLYVNNWHQNVVKYEPPFASATVIDAAQPTGLAVDPAGGDVYVAHRTYVAEYEPSGAPVEVGGQPVQIGLGSLGEAYGVAVSDFPATAGFLYVPDAEDNIVKVYDPATSLSTPVEEIDGIGTPQGAFTDLRDAEVAVDNSPTSPSYGHVFVLDAIGHGLSEHPAAALDEFNAAGDYRGQITGFTDAEPSGVAIESAPGPSDGNVYITSGNTEASSVFLYGPTAPARTLKVTKEGPGGGMVTSSPKAIVCGPACSAEFNEGQAVTLFASPDSHSALSGWSVSGSEPCPGTGSCTVVMAANVEVRASFTEPTQQTLSVTATGSGTVTSNPAGISCPGACTEHFNEGRLITLSAHPDLHNRLLHWSGCESEPSPTECKVTMSAAKALGAEFGPIPQKTLTVTKVGSGQGTLTSFPEGISCPPNCSAQFDEGATVYLVAAPAPTSSFAGFSGGGCSGIAPFCEVMMSQAQSLSAEFLAGGPGASAQLKSAAHLSLGPARVSGASASLELAVPEPGTLFFAGSGLQGKQTKVGAGQVSVRLVLSKAGRRALSRRRQLPVRAAVAFLPADGEPAASASELISFRAGHGGRAKEPRRSRHPQR